MQPRVKNNVPDAITQPMWVHRICRYQAAIVWFLGVADVGCSSTPPSFPRKRKSGAFACLPPIYGHWIPDIVSRFRDESKKHEPVGAPRERDCAGIGIGAH